MNNVYVLSQEEWSGLSGGASWSGGGGLARAGARLQVAELARGGALRGAGRWAPGEPVTWTRPAEPARIDPPDSMVNRTFNVLVVKVR